MLFRSRHHVLAPIKEPACNQGTRSVCAPSSSCFVLAQRHTHALLIHLCFLRTSASAGVLR